MTTFTADDGARIAYTDTGTGRPLLCLAGLTRNHSDFDYIAPHLPEGTRVIAMDYRGRGGSDWTGADSYTIAREGADALNLLDHLGIATAPILGTSRGGLIAMELAASHAERLSGVILNDVGPELGAAGLARIMQYLGEPPQHPDFESAARAMQAEHAAEFPSVSLSVWRRQAEAQFRETETGLALRYDPRLRRAVLEQAASEKAPDLWLLFNALKSLPVGLLHGANSDILRPETVAEMRRRHPGLMVADVADRGHVPFLDEPQSLELIRAILAEAECLTLT